MSQERFKKILKYTLTFILVGAIIKVIINNARSLQRLNEIDFSYVLYFIGLVALNFAVLGGAQYLILRQKKVRMRFSEWYGLGLIAKLYNQILPLKGGTFLRSYYMKQYHNLKLKDFGWMMIVQVMLKVAGAAALISSLIYFSFAELNFFEKTQYSFLVLGLGILAVSVLYTRKWISYLLRFKFGVQSDLSLIQIKPRILASVGGLMLMNIGIRGLRFYLGFSALQIPIDVAHAFFVGALLMLITLVSVTPGNLGVREFFVGGALHYLGYSLSDAVVVSLLDRAAALLFILPAGIFFNWKLMPNLDKGIDKRNSVG